MDVTFILILLLMSGFFSGSESALFTIRWWRLNYLRHHGGESGRRLAELMDHPGSVLTTILLGNTLVNVAAGSVFEHTMEIYLPEHALVVAITVMTLVIMIFCEITPKTIALRMPEKIALKVAPAIGWLSMVILPVRLLAERLSLTMTRSFRKSTEIAGKHDFMTMVNEGRQAGILTSTEHHIMARIIGMQTAPVTDVMIPRTDIIALPDNIDFDEAVQAILQYDFQRIPLFNQSIDNIVGILYAKDLLSGWLNPVLRRSPRALARSPVFVPSHITLKQLSHELGERKRHLAIVLDEYGGTAGMITHNGVLRSIFHIADADTTSDPDIERLPEGGWEVDARMAWKKLCRLLDLPDRPVPFRTLNGFLLDYFGRVPSDGEFMVIPKGSDSQSDVWKLTITRSEPIRIQTVRIKLEVLAAEPDEEAEPDPDSEISRYE